MNDKKQPPAPNARRFKWLPPNAEHPVSIHTSVPTSQAARYLERGASLELSMMMAVFEGRMQLLWHSLAFCQIHRTHAEQTEKYAQGRTKPGKIVTDALPHQSAHCAYEGPTPASQAFDICQVAGGKYSWDMNADDSRFWSDARDTGNMLGLVWGATFNKPPRDFGHFQLSTFKAGKK